jgi:hypothetical protein
MYYDYIDEFNTPVVKGKFGTQYAVLKSMNSSRETEHYEYKFNTIGKNLMEMAEWCEENLNGDWIAGCNKCMAWI